jgi:hypothetical protein
MKRHVVFGFLLFAVLSCAAQNTSSPQPLILYDDFNHPFLGPSKWSSVPGCFTTNGVEQECVRQIRSGKLYLAHRNYGNPNTDSGSQFGSAFVAFANPSKIKSITAEITFKNYFEVPCLANPEFGAAAHIDATFFNTGTGNPSDDVGGHLGLGRGFSDPPDQVSVFGQINQGGNYSYLFLGTVKIGTPVNATLAWDQPNHQFLVSWTNLITHVTTNETMPYTFADTAPPTNPSKVLTANTFPDNCTAAPAWVYIEATFDNVYIGLK